MIRALIIDDESHIREDIRDNINNSFNEHITIVGEAITVKEGIEEIEKHLPDIVFLDIHLPDGTGFDIMSKVNFKDFALIFITGFDNLAIQAIKVGALDYILKPIDDDEFKTAVFKAIKNTKKDKYLEKLIDVSNDYFIGAKKKRIVLKTLDTIYTVNEDDILYCKSDGSYTTFHMLDSEKILVSKSLKNIQELLSDSVFIRCHQSYLVNKNYVRKYDLKGLFVLSTNDKIPVSGRLKDASLKRIFN